MNQDSNNERSFRKSGPVPVRLKEDEHCSLKRHYRNILREVIGYLDKMAEIDPGHERFVWSSIPDITKHCNKFRKEKEPYDQRIVEYAVKYLRETYAISKPLERVRFNVKQTGFIVAPHKARFRKARHGKGSVCQPDYPLGRWESDCKPGGARWWVAGPESSD